MVEGVAKLVSKMESMKCSNCEKTTRRQKIDKTKASSRHYRSRFCDRGHIPEKKRQGYSDNIRQKAIRMYVDGIG